MGCSVMASTPQIGMSGGCRNPDAAALAGVIVLGQALELRTVLAIGFVVAASVGTTLGAKPAIDAEVRP